MSLHLTILLQRLFPIPLHFVGTDVMTVATMAKKKHKTELLQLRISERQKQAYDDTAAAQDKHTSEWAREVLDAAVREFRSTQNNDS
jgi:hypothetical protein